jgi:hypothetical protein
MTKMGWATFWATFAQNHLATLLQMPLQQNVLAPVRTSQFDSFQN